MPIPQLVCNPPCYTLSPQLPRSPTPLLQLVLRLNSHDYPALAASMVVPVLASLWHKLLGKDEFA